MIETENLKIYAASQNEMENFIEMQTNDVLKASGDVSGGASNFITVTIY